MFPDQLRAVAHFGSAFDAQDVDAVMAMMTDNCVFESTAGPDGVRAAGKVAVRAVWTEFFAGSQGPISRWRTCSTAATGSWPSGATTSRVAAVPTIAPLECRAGVGYLGWVHMRVSAELGAGTGRGSYCYPATIADDRAPQLRC
jgi:hypothetical protein